MESHNLKSANSSNDAGKQVPVPEAILWNVATAKSSVGFSIGITRPAIWSICSWPLNRNLIQVAAQVDAVRSEIGVGSARLLGRTLNLLLRRSICSLYPAALNLGNQENFTLVAGNHTECKACLQYFTPLRRQPDPCSLARNLRVYALLMSFAPFLEAFECYIRIWAFLTHSAQAFPELINHKMYCTLLNILNVVKSLCIFTSLW